jgi:CRP/FNR family transcriptional regulator, nitrogen fixation regulation protein
MLTQTAFRSDAMRRPPISHSPVPPSPVAPRRDVPAAHTTPAGTPESAPLAQQMTLMGATMSFARNAEIFGENEPADYLYKVISGAVRTYKILSDGRRQVGGFYLPGDIFGLEFANEHSLAAEAITNAKVLVIKRSALTTLAERDAGTARGLYALTARELQHAQGRIMLLVKSAQERVASFLLEMAERGAAGNAIELPMSRQDIADYLGLTIETVSRTLTSLETAAAIDVPSSRRIVLRNRGALSRLNG